MKVTLKNPKFLVFTLNNPKLIINRCVIYCRAQGWADFILNGLGWRFLFNYQHYSHVGQDIISGNKTEWTVDWVLPRVFISENHCLYWTEITGWMCFKNTLRTSMSCGETSLDWASLLVITSFDGQLNHQIFFTSKGIYLHVC